MDILIEVVVHGARGAPLMYGTGAVMGSDIMYGTGAVMGSEIMYMSIC